MKSQAEKNKSKCWTELPDLGDLIAKGAMKRTD